MLTCHRTGTIAFIGDWGGWGTGCLAAHPQGWVNVFVSERSGGVGHKGLKKKIKTRFVEYGEQNEAGEEGREKEGEKKNRRHHTITRNGLRAHFRGRKRDHKVAVICPPIHTAVFVISCATKLLRFLDPKK
jgi:hypothetical protein